MFYENDRNRKRKIELNLAGWSTCLGKKSPAVLGAREVGVFKENVHLEKDEGLKDLQRLLLGRKCRKRNRSVGLQQQEDRIEVGEDG